MTIKMSDGRNISHDQYLSERHQGLRKAMSGYSIKNIRAALRRSAGIDMRPDGKGGWDVVVSFKNEDIATQALDLMEIEKGEA